jgi:hypothetical protein
MNKYGKNQHYSYFELMDAICDRHYQRHMISNHPKYYEYKEWRRNKELEEIRRRVWEKEMGRVTRNDLMQQTRMVESKKKKFLFW